MADDPFVNFTPIALADFPYFFGTCAGAMLEELTLDPLSFASLMPRGVMSESKDAIKMDNLPVAVQKASAWMKDNWDKVEDTSDPWRFKAVGSEELLLKLMRRYMGFYLECVEEWGYSYDGSVREHYPEPFAAFVEAFHIVLFVPPLLQSAIALDLNLILQKQLNPEIEGDGWMYVSP